MADIRIIDLPTSNINLSGDYFIFESQFEDVPNTFITSKNTLSSFKNELDKHFVNNQELSATITVALSSGQYINQTTSIAYSIAL
jgi:hypothetical protein